MDLHVRNFTAMGTPCELRLVARTASEAAQCADEVITDVRRLEARYSRYRPDSELSAINRVAAAGGTVQVDAETAALLDYAQTCHAQSEGLFDISSGLLRQAWRFAEGALPQATLIEQLLSHIGWDKLRWQAPVLEFPHPGMELDFGGIVKEYAVDRAAAMLQRAGVQHGFINLGGDIRVIGPQPDGAPWRIGIRHPRDPQALLRTLDLSSGALASSGDYERCIVIDGVRYGHILNPRTGWPVRSLAAVSVAAPLCVVAGSAATIAMLKEEDGPAWLESLGLAHLCVSVDGTCTGPLSPR